MNDPILVRIGPKQMAEVTIVVRCDLRYKWRLKAAMILMRIAGRLGGFRDVKLVRQK